MNNSHQNSLNPREYLLDALLFAIKFKTYTEFCERCDEILDNFKIISKHPQFKLSMYKNYVYNNHKFSDNMQRDLEAKDKIWLWLMSYEYEPMTKNDLYSTLGQLKKGR